MAVSFLKFHLSNQALRGIDSSHIRLLTSIDNTLFHETKYSKNYIPKYLENSAPKTKPKAQNNPSSWKKEPRELYCKSSLFHFLPLRCFCGNDTFFLSFSFSFFSLSICLCLSKPSLFDFLLLGIFYSS